ncbi:MAG: 16S rRNA (uracil(1498)-N(3))-methyltransferase [Nocardioidaceae bacterium]
MTLPVFLVATEALRHDLITLDGDEARHAHVKRVRVGEQVLLTDGLGAGAECEVVSVAKAAVDCAVLVRRVAPPAVPRLTVVQAIPKGEHADRAVDLLTEVGADAIVPWMAARNVVQWRGDKTAKGVARWRAVATASAKQARRLRFPDVSHVHCTDEVVDLVREAGLSLVLHESASEPLAVVLDGFGRDSPPDMGHDGLGVEDVVILVGPEGGITDVELTALAEAGGRVVGMGPTVLRSSSAGTVAAALVLSHTARWR